tara:strand:+ start:931 stop:1218 length:288 start_codon:yes stop_codon:yes gene_type:complete
MRATKKEKMGNYICKIGKYDVRQIMNLGGIKKSFGKTTQHQGACEGRIYLGKKLIKGNLRDAKQAIEKAFELTCKQGTQQYVSKKLLNKHNLVCS